MRCAKNRQGYILLYHKKYYTPIRARLQTVLEKYIYIGKHNPNDGTEAGDAACQYRAEKRAARISIMSFTNFHTWRGVIA